MIAFQHFLIQLFVIILKRIAFLINIQLWVRLLFKSNKLFNRISFLAHGKCQAKTLSFKVMRNKGTRECEEWIFEYLDVPIACECFLSKTSFLHAVPEL